MRELSRVTLPPYDGFDPKRDPASDAITRRAMLVRAGGVGLSSFTLAGLLAACGSGNQSNDTSGGSQAAGDAPGRGGTLTLAVDGTNGIADPAFYTTLGDWMAVDCICRGLTFISFTDVEPQPDLAERWELSDDGRIYRFFLREGVTFHDGTTLSSKDVVRSLERQLNPKDPTLPPGGSGPFFTAVGDNVRSIKGVDDMTVEFRLRVPDAQLLAKLSDIGGRVISSAALEKYKRTSGPTSPAPARSSSSMPARARR
jgi:peptide/nickel transport system substrate-binding protein